MATKPSFPFEKSKGDKERPSFGKEGSKREEAIDKRQANKSHPDKKIPMAPQGLAKGMGATAPSRPIVGQTMPKAFKKGGKVC